MPKTIIAHPETDLKRSLGKLAYWWIRNFVVYGGGSVRGLPVQFGPERYKELQYIYALSKTGKRLHSSVFYSKPKGTDKSGFAAYLICFEAVGPARFAGWAEGGETYTFLGKTYRYKRGEPMGRAVIEPVIRAMATEEDQSNNIFDVVLHNFQDGPLAATDSAAFSSYINTPGRGQILPSTSGAASKDGGRETFVAVDETHLYVTKQLKSAYNTVTRNLTKRPLEEPWLLETSTMYAPGQQSIAEETYAFAKLIEAKKAKRPNLLFIHNWGSIEEDDIADEAKLRVALLDAYGEAAAWLDVDATIATIYDPRNSIQDSVRYFLNAVGGFHDSWVTPSQIENVLVDETLQPGDEIALGMDGALTGDATALVAVRLSDGLSQLLHLQEAPAATLNVQNWIVDQGAVDRAVFQAFNEFDVKAFFADPPYWQDFIAGWEKEFGDSLVVNASGNSKISFWTTREYAMISAVERAETALTTKTLKISRQPDFIRHLTNARKWTKRTGHVIGKDMKGSSNKMDAAVAFVLAFAAAAAAKAFVPKETKAKKMGAGLVSDVPLELLVPKIRSGR